MAAASKTPSDKSRMELGASRTDGPGAPPKHAAGAFRGVLTLLSGSVAAQLLPLALTPLLTRLFDPVAFGVFGVFLAIENMLAAVAAGRFDVAVVLPGGEGEAQDVAAAALTTSLGFAAALAAVSLAAALWPLGRAQWVFLVLMPPMVLLAGFCQTMSFWASRHKDFRRVAAGQLVQMGGYTLSSAVIGLAGLHDGRGLVAGYMVGQVAVTVLFAVATRGDLGGILSRVGRRSALATMREHRRFPLVNAPHALVDGLRDSAVVVLVTAAFGAAANGAYSFAMRVLRTPTATLGQAVFHVIYQRSSEAHSRGEEVRRLTLRAVGWLVAATLPLYALALPFMPSLFAFVFGARWREAGVYAQILMPWLYLNLVAGAVSCVPLLKGRQLGAFSIAIVDAVLRCLAVLVGWKLGSARVALVAMSVSGSVMTALLIGWYVRLLGEPAAVADAPAVLRVGEM